MNGWHEAEKRFKATKWEVSIEQCTNFVRVGAHRGLLYHTDQYGGAMGTWFVKPPNLIERKLGITYQEKVERAKIKCQKYCDKQNKIEKEAQLVIS